jgi:acetylornithine/succinyldiaminopimelate/putrescine aminotransferase
MGRTGKFCAFMHEGDDVVPDVVTLAKTLGGGKRAIGAMVTSQKLFDRAYGNRQDCTLHTSGFGGLGESCAVAIEALNVLFDEDLIGRAAARGAYMREKLLALQAKHPKAILEVRGKGCFQAVKLDFNTSLADKVAASAGNSLFKTYQTVLVAGVVRELFERHGVLAHFQPGALDIIHFMPPLIVEEAHIDQMVAGLDEILTRGIADSTVSFIARNVKRVVTAPLGHEERAIA